MRIRKTLFLSMFLILGLLVFMPNTVNADVGGTFSANGFNYEILTEGENKAVKITRYTGSETELIIPSEVNGYTITEIGMGAFAGSSIEKVTFQDDSKIEIIGGSAFYDCNLTKVIVPESVNKLDYCVFGNCSSLTELWVLNEECEIGINILTDCPSDLVVYGFDDSTIERYLERTYTFKEIYRVTNTLTNITSNGLSYAHKDLGDYTTTLVVNAGYELPEIISIKVNGINLSSDEYEYNSENGNLKINAEKIDGNIEIEAFGEKIIKVSFDGNGGLFSRETKKIEYDNMKDCDFSNLAVPTNDGYKFIGYYTKDGKSIDDIMNSEEGFVEDTCFYAEWVSIIEEYVIDFSTNPSFEDLSNDDLALIELLISIGELNYSIDNSFKLYSANDIEKSRMLLEIDVTNEQIILGEKLTNEDNISYELTDEDKELLIENYFTFIPNTVKLKFWKDKNIQVVIEGNSNFTIGTDDTLTFALNTDRYYGKVLVNDVELSESNGDYEWKFTEGTFPTIELSEKYLKTLKNGTYTIKFLLENGTEANSTFTILGNQNIENKDNATENNNAGNVSNNNPENDTSKNDNKIENIPSTGDNIVLYIVGLLISVVCIAIIVKVKKYIK